MSERMVRTVALALDSVYHRFGKTPPDVATVEALARAAITAYRNAPADGVVRYEDV